MLEDLKQVLSDLNLEDLQALRSWIEAEIASREATQAPPAQAGAEVLEERRIGSRTYRLVRVRCGKPNCKCGYGERHGPYWYAYWWQGGKVRSRYIGKELRRI